MSTIDTTEQLRDRLWNGQPVTNKEWLAARRRESESAARAETEAELAALRAEVEHHAHLKQIAVDLEHEIQEFTDSTIKPLQDAYRDYVLSRRHLVELLESYAEKHHEIARACKARRPYVYLDPPPELNQWAYINLADREARGDWTVEPHLLNSGLPHNDGTGGGG